MIYLVDTNILLRLSQKSNSLHRLVHSALNTLSRDGHQLALLSQNCIEFWNVATRPLVNNGFGLSAADADALLSEIEQLFLILPDCPEIYSEWRNLVQQFRVCGVQVHDARLVAAMKVYQIQHILSLNGSDFTRYATTGIIAISPTEIAPEEPPHA